MAPRQITFVEDSGTPFINYGLNRDTSSPTGLRVRTLHGRALQVNRLKQSKQRYRHRAPAARSQGLELIHGGQEKILQDPKDILSTFARDPFTDESLGQARDLEATWLASFPAYFWLPYVDSRNSNLPSPHDTFLKASRSSHVAYKNLVVNATATSLARADQEATQNVFKQQAAVMEAYRSMVDYYHRHRLHLSRTAFQDVYSAAFSFLGSDFGREPAYNAVVYANFHLLALPENFDLKQMPTVEWIRTMMPRPNETFNRTPDYQRFMLNKIHEFLNFFDQIQTSAYSVDAFCQARLYFGRASALRKMITTPVSVGAGPYPHFHIVCLNRILFLLSLHLSHQRQKGLIQNDDFMLAAENVARECLAYEAPSSVALFLWGLLTTIDVLDLEWMQVEQKFTIPAKEILVALNINLASHLIDWLTLDSASSYERRYIDIEALRTLLQRVYDPGARGPLPASPTNWQAPLLEPVSSMWDEMPGPVSA